MDTIVFLITLSAGALAVHYKERLRHFVPGRQADPRALVDQSLGLARLELPEGWRDVLLDYKRGALDRAPLPSGIFISAEINDPCWSIACPSAWSAAPTSKRPPTTSGA